jgi:hypothetical protein
MKIRSAIFQIVYRTGSSISRGGTSSVNETALTVTFTTAWRRQRVSWLLAPFLLATLSLFALTSLFQRPVTNAALWLEDEGPAIALAKTVAPAIVFSGDWVTYTYVITNTGDTALSQVILTDDQLGPIGDVIELLEPAEIRTYITSTQVYADITNIAVVTGTVADDAYTAQASAFVQVITPSVELALTAVPAIILAGETVTFTYFVTNSGNILLEDVTVVDQESGIVVGGPVELAPEGIVSFTQAIAVANDLTHTAIVTGVHPLGTTGDSASVFVNVIAPAIQVNKTVTPAIILSGQVVTYTYVVSNSGDFTLTDITLVDDRLGTIGAIAELLPQQVSAPFFRSLAISSTVLNQVTVTGTHPAGFVNHSDTALVTVITPAIQLSKSVAPAVVFSGETVTYTYRITNTGNITLSNVLLNDDKLGQILPPQSLAPNATLTVLQTAQPALDVTNLATVSGAHPAGGVVTANASAFVKVNHRVFLPAALNNWPQWQLVGNVPAGVTKFYHAVTCQGLTLTGTDNGLYRLQGNSWQLEASVPASSASGIFINRLAFNAACNQVYVATAASGSTPGAGLWRGVYDGSWTWQRLTTLSPDKVYAVAVRNNTVFAATVDGVYYASIPANAGDPHVWQATPIKALTLGLTLPPGSDTIYAAVWTQGVFRLQGPDNAGWVQQGALSNPLVYEAVGTVSTPLLAGTSTGLFRWNNGWTAVAGYSQPVYAVATFDNYLYAGLRDTLLVSADGGLSWTPRLMGLNMPPGTEFQARGFFVDSSGGCLYAATTSGVYCWPLP